MPGPELSIGKLALTNNLTNTAEFVAKVLGPRMVADTGEWGTYAWNKFLLGVPGMRVAGGTDEEILAWAESRGGFRRTDDDCLAWNHFLMKLGLRDDRAPIIRQRKIDSGMASLPIETFFDLIEYDEGRDPQRDRPWEKV